MRRIEFGLSEDKENELKNEAIKEACKDARTKADAMASGLGLRIIRVATARESGVYVVPISGRRIWWWIWHANANSSSNGNTSTNRAKEVKASATIDVVYECK
ncbi:hypothetical protein C5S36_09815 [Candidatus Methanophagaceae archaeon]|nr:hypothetical protein C5S36_09815 [Methanophagales archaeon]